MLTLTHASASTTGDIAARKQFKRAKLRTFEHQAEAAAFAAHFLLATAATTDPEAQAAVLDHYDLLVPGTRVLARYFALQPAFEAHPMRALLIAGRHTS